MFDGDIKLRAARLMTDDDEAGGPMSGTDIVSNQIGNLGVVIADLDELRGFVFLRKVFPHVDTPNTDILYKASLIISQPPVDSNIRSALFLGGDWFGKLAEARAALESAVTIQEIWGFNDWSGGHAGIIGNSVGQGETHITIRISSLYRGTDWFTAYLANKIGYHALCDSFGEFQEFIHVTSIDFLTDVDLVEGGATFSYKDYRLNLSAPLNDTFVPGSIRYIDLPTMRFFGIAPLAALAGIDDAALTVSSPYYQLFPAGNPAGIGIDTSHLPPDGNVPIFRLNDLVVVHHTATLTLPSPVTAGSTHAAGRTDLSRVKVLDFDGTEIPPGETTYTANLTAGAITFADTDHLNLTGYVQPLRFVHRVEDEAVITGLSSTVDGYQITLSQPLTHDYPVGSYVSSALEMGNLHARVSGLFTQEYWTGAWSDERIGNEPEMRFSYFYNVDVTNQSAIEERWALIFSSPFTYRCIGEKTGLLALDVNISTTFSPLNPYTGQPLFVIPAGAFGPGGQAGNVFRFNTHAASRPPWLALTVLPGVASDIERDSVELYIRGNSA